MNVAKIRVVLLMGAIVVSGCSQGSGGENSNDNDNANNNNNSNSIGICGDSEISGTEVCDSSALGGHTCQSEGFGGGGLACDSDCTLNIDGCCDHECSAGGTRCDGSVLQDCEPEPEACRAWVVRVDCDETGWTCNDSTGTAHCCLDRCQVGEYQCNGDLIEECGVGPEGCLDWITHTQCTSMEFCSMASGTPVCALHCVPGAGGMVAGGVTQLSTGLTYEIERYVAPDDDPNGWVYFGGSTQLYRIPKAGGAVEDINAIAGIDSGYLGYAFVVNGQDIIAIDNDSGTGQGLVHRLSSNGGANWNVEEFATLPVDIDSALRGATAYGGQIHLMEYQMDNQGVTRIFAVDDNPAQLPAMAVEVAAFSGYYACSGLAADDSYYYTACAGSEEVIRVERATSMVASLAFLYWDISIISNTLQVADLTGDGVADVLYLQTSFSEAYYLCDPSTANGNKGDLVSFGGGFGVESGVYGMGYDPAAHVLWFYDDYNHDVVEVQ